MIEPNATPTQDEADDFRLSDHPCRADAKRQYDRRRRAQWWEHQYPASCWPEPSHHRCTCAACFGLADDADRVIAERLHLRAVA
jgi:hypothetical protein